MLYWKHAVAWVLSSKSFVVVLLLTIWASMVFCGVIFVSRNRPQPPDSALVFVEAQLTKHPGVSLWRVSAEEFPGGQWTVQGWYHLKVGTKHHWSRFRYQLHVDCGSWVMVPYLATIPNEHLKDMPDLGD